MVHRVSTIALVGTAATETAEIASEENEENEEIESEAIEATEIEATAETEVNVVVIVTDDADRGHRDIPAEITKVTPTPRAAIIGSERERSVMPEETVVRNEAAGNEIVAVGTGEGTTTNVLGVTVICSTIEVDVTTEGIEMGLVVNVQSNLRGARVHHLRRRSLHQI